MTVKDLCSKMYTGNLVRLFVWDGRQYAFQDTYKYERRSKNSGLYSNEYLFRLYGDMDVAYFDLTYDYYLLVYARYV